LVTREFGERPFAGDYYGSAGGIDLDGMLKRSLGGESEQFLEHFDHVFVGVFVVVEQNYVK
jgi:hypothetical protein